MSQSKKYMNSIGRVERTSKNFYQYGRGSAEMVQGADQARRLAHESFIASLNTVSRNAAKQGIDIKNLAPYLRDRTRATDLASQLAKT